MSKTLAAGLGAVVVGVFGALAPSALTDLAQTTDKFIHHGLDDPRDNEPASFEAIAK